jgi:hypothetical protein
MNRCQLCHWMTMMAAQAWDWQQQQQCQQQWREPGRLQRAKSSEQWQQQQQQQLAAAAAAVLRGLRGAAAVRRELGLGWWQL